jgi:hypothetical protein
MDAYMRNMTAEVEAKAEVLAEIGYKEYLGARLGK